MVSLRVVEDQLKQIGCNFRLWGRTEIRELGNVLMPDEKIAQVVNGTYEGGFAMLCVTQYRVLLIDRKPMLLTIEDIRYDMIAEVDFNTRVLLSAVRIFTPMRNLVFNSWSHHRMRKCAGYIQQRVMEVRQQSMLMGQQFQPGASTPLPVSMQQPLPAGQASSMGSQQGIFSSSTKSPVNPYTKMPMLARRRRFPNYY